MKTVISNLVSIKRAFFKAILLGALLASGLANVGQARADQLNNTPQSPAEAGKVHLILTGDVSCPNIGPQCQSDIAAVYQKFNSIFNKRQADSWRGRLKVHHLVGDAWTADKILTYVRGGSKTEKGLTIGKNDVAVFYFAGHGGIKDTAKPYETFSLWISPKDPLNRAQVRDALLRHSPRGVILLTDCCSAAKPLQGIKTMKLTGQRPAAAWNMNVATMHNLFLKFRGLVDITAAEIDTVSIDDKNLGFGDSRGAFTTAFLRVACETQAVANWETFAKRVNAETLFASGNAQRPHVFYNLDSLTANVKTTVSMP